MFQTCPACGHTNFKRARQCGGCGVVLQRPARGEVSWPNLVYVCLLGLLLVCGAAGGLYWMVIQIQPHLTPLLGL